MTVSDAVSRGSSFVSSQVLIQKYFQGDRVASRAVIQFDLRGRVNFTVKGKIRKGTMGTPQH